MTEYYMVFLVPRKGIQQSDVKAKMDLAIDWLSLNPRTWIVCSSSPIDLLYARLLPLAKPDGQLFISRLDPSERRGWMLKGFWEWLRKDRNQK